MNNPYQQQADNPDPDANCGKAFFHGMSIDPDIWFNPRTERIAVSICNECPLRIKCADFAIRRGEEYGVWGGMTEKQRKQIMRIRR